MFVWSLNPILYAIFLFLFDFGTALTLYTIFDPKGKGYNFRTFWIGDTVLIPLIGFFSATSLMGMNLATTYLGNPFWIITIVLGGYCLIALSEVLNFQNKRINQTTCRRASWLYHAAISGPMFLLVVGPLPLVFTLPQVGLSHLVIAVCLALFLCLVYIDFLLPRKANKLKLKG